MVYLSKRSVVDIFYVAWKTREKFKTHFLSRRERDNMKLSVFEKIVFYCNSRSEFFRRRSFNFYTLYFSSVCHESLKEGRFSIVGK